MRVEFAKNPKRSSHTPPSHSTGSCGVAGGRARRKNEDSIEEMEGIGPQEQNNCKSCVSSLTPRACSGLASACSPFRFVNKGDSKPTDLLGVRGGGEGGRGGELGNIHGVYSRREKKK